jgi:hypothetical protein
VRNTNRTLYVRSIYYIYDTVTYVEIYHHHYQTINVSTAEEQPFLMDYT